MANFESVPKKRKLDQLEDETQSSSNKKIKAEEYNYEEDTFSFSTLPPEIVHFILSFITNDTQRRHIRSVCQQWFAQINYNEFKIGLLLTSEVDEFSRCFGRYQKPIGLKFMKLDYLNNLNSRWNSNKTLIRPNHFSSMLSSLTQLTALDLCLKNFEIPRELVNLQSLSVISPLHGYTISRLTNLRRLKTDSQFAETPTTLESLDLYNNEKIDIAIDSTYAMLTELKILTTTRCEIPDALANLRKLSIFELRTSYDWLNPQMISLQKFPNLEEFITSAQREQLPSQYPSTLTKLQALSSSTVKITEDLTQLRDLKCYQVILNNSQLNLLQDCVVQNKNETTLEHVDSQTVTKLQITVMPENIDLFNRFTNLIDLGISLCKSPVDALSYCNLVPLTRLTRLMLIYQSYPQQWMTQLPNLVHLSLQNFDSTPEPINFETMHQLTSLVLRGRYDSISIINLTNLLELEIDNESASNVTIQGLSNATNLTGLSVKQKNLHCSFSAVELSELALLTNLRMLCLGRNPNTEMTNIADLTTLQRLTFLEVRAINQSTYHLMRLSRLQKVYMATIKPHEVDHSVILKGLPFCYHFEVL